MELDDLKDLRDEICKMTSDDNLTKIAFQQLEFRFEQLDSKEKIDRAVKINNCIFGIRPTY